MTTNSNKDKDLEKSMKIVDEVNEQKKAKENKEKDDKARQAMFLCLHTMDRLLDVADKLWEVNSKKSVTSDIDKTRQIEVDLVFHSLVKFACSYGRAFFEDSKDDKKEVNEKEDDV